MAEIEAIIKSRPLTLESLSDVNNEIPLSPSNLLTMKSDVIMPPPGVLNRPECSILWNNILTAAEKAQKSLPKLRTTIKEKLLSMTNEIVFAQETIKAKNQFLSETNYSNSGFALKIKELDDKTLMDFCKFFPVIQDSSENDFFSVFQLHSLLFYDNLHILYCIRMLYNDSNATFQ